LPRFDRPFTRAEKWAFRNVPGFPSPGAHRIYTGREVQVVGLAKHPNLMKGFELLSRANIRTGIKTPRSASVCSRSGSSA
jgi:hypothetical protein